MNVIKLEEMGTILMHIALQYTHPDFESMYSDWSTVHDIGEKLVKMSDQPQLNENQQIVLDWLKEEKTNSSLTAFDCIYSFIYGNPKDIVTQIWSELNAKEEAQVLEAFGKWAQEQWEE